MATSDHNETVVANDIKEQSFVPSYIDDAKSHVFEMRDLVAWAKRDFELRFA